MLVILTPFYNARENLARCVDSIRGQRSDDWHCYLIDDASTDGSYEFAHSLIGSDSRFELIRNAERQYQVGNYYCTLHRLDIPDSAICVTVDADDWLPDDGVFRRVLDAYRDGQVWITWGSFVIGHPSSLKHGCSRPVADVTALRTGPWSTSHLRTFKVFLFRAIAVNDLRGPDGRFWPCAGDRAIMFPMLEMAGNEHARHLPDINYVYNRQNPLSEEFSQTALSTECARLVSARKPYPLLRSRIPRVIHQMWIGPHRPPERAMQTWRDINPTWEYRLWREDNLTGEPFRNKRQIDAVRPWNKKCDLMRYELLHSYGGVFIDADSECLAPLDDFFLLNDAFACFENETAMPGLIATGYLGAAPQNDFMNVLIHDAGQIPIERLKSEAAWRVVGPKFLTDVVQRTSYSKLKVYPSWYFIPVHRTGLRYSGWGPVYANQYWGTTFGLYAKDHEGLYGESVAPSAECEQ